MALPVYSSRDVTLAFMGTTLEGLAEDSFITFSRNSAVTETETGADGRVAISYLPDETGTCTISLQQNSPSNLILSGVMNAQRLQRQVFIGGLAVADPSGALLAKFSNCHLQETPDVDLGSSANGKTRDWVFFVEDMLWTSAPEGNALANETVARIVSGVDTIKSLL